MVDDQRTRIITVTLSPSLERTHVTHYLAVGYHNQTHGATRLDPAGMGVNIARALHRLAFHSYAVILLGDDATGRAYQAMISTEGFDKALIRTSGRTRSRTIILDTGTGDETHIIEEEAGLTPDDIEQVMQVLREIISRGDVVVFGGALPTGVPTDSYVRLAEAAREAGARTVLISPGLPLLAAINTRPDMVALSQIEVEGLLNYPVRSRRDVIGAANELRRRGAGDVLVQMRDSGSAVLVGRDGSVWLVDLPDILSGTTSGVWDALLAGFVAGLMRNNPIEEALELGAAAATFTASQVGSEFGSWNDVQTYVQAIDVTTLPDVVPPQPAPTQDSPAEG